MPSSTQGFTGTEIVNRVINYVGNTKANFRTYVENSLPLAEFRYCNMHPWKFLIKQDLSLPIVSGTNEYTLDSSTIGHYMSASDVGNIFDPPNGRVLLKISLKDLRRLDPEVDDGDTESDIQFWATSNDNKILVWPPNFEGTELKIDGVITPGALTTLSNFPTIPFKYQEGFIEYVISMALDRENDDRAQLKKQEAFALINADIRDDLYDIGSTDLPRFRSDREAAQDGFGSGNLEQAYFNYLFSYWY